MKTRRRVFALPFVAIIGCGGSPKTSTREPTPTNPPGPTETTPATGDDLAPAPEGAPIKGTGPAGQVMLTYPDGTIVYVATDGTCHAEYKENCGPQDPNAGPARCNPPPPQQVRCPADAK